MFAVPAVIDGFASLPHYWHHLQPIWAALPPEDRGTFWSPDRDHPWGIPLSRRRDPARAVLVASWRDSQTVTPSRVVLIEHGAGQAYRGDERGARSESYAGGPGHERAVLFVCPSETVADRWRVSYPNTPAAVVGCPRLDRYHRPDGDDRATEPSRDGPRADRPVVAVTFHWQCPLVPETTSAWPHYDRVLPALAADDRWQLLGHGHPRLWGKIRRRWQQLGVDHTPDSDDVLARADLLVVDNSSIAFEFASLGKPVVLVNAPHYRRQVEHGLRFWSFPPGVQVDHPDELAGTVARMLEGEPPVAVEIRRRAVEHVYAHTDGHASERAATAIMEVL